MKPIIQYVFPTNQYKVEETKKIQVYLHHTAGNSSAMGTFKFWESNPEKIGTCIVINGLPDQNDQTPDGTIVQGYSSKYWAYHLGLKEQTFDKFGIPYKSLDRISIGIEICNWGQLVSKGGKFYNYVNRIVSNDQVTELTTPFRGFKFYHSYTDAQIESVKELLLLWKDKWGISLQYQDDIWDVCPRALRGEVGIFTHCSVRYDKTDIYPHPKMIAMLKTL